MRMPFWKELKWLLAVKLWWWSYRLIENEADRDLIAAYQATAENFRNATPHNTVRMQTKTEK